MRAALIGILIATGFFVAPPVQAQNAPTPETIAAARELVDVIKPIDQFKAVVPTLFANFKAAIVQGRPEVEKQYDAMIPLFNQSAEKRLNELVGKIVTIYASNFSVDDLHAIAAFYHTPTGQKFISKQPIIAQQSLAAGQQFGQEVANDVKEQMSQQAK
jgi:hypothetical protein